MERIDGCCGRGLGVSGLVTVPADVLILEKTDVLVFETGVLARELIVNNGEVVGVVAGMDGEKTAIDAGAVVAASGMEGDG